MRMTTSEDSTDLWSPADAAEAYAALGWCVIPIAPGRKHPPVPEWQKAATDNLDTIRSWWSGLYRGHGVGVTTGARSGFWVLDIDIANGKPGDESLTALMAEHGDLPATVEAVTGSGGGHLLYAWDPARPVTNGMATRLPPGLDIRGEGGQIVVAPTLHPSGAPYEWLPDRGPWDVDIAPAPDWLYQLLLTDPEPVAAPPRAPLPDLEPVRRDGPADWIRDRWDWPTELQREGWTWHSAHPGQSWWTRPGKAARDGHSAVLHEPDGPLVVFSTEVPANVLHAGTSTRDGSGVSFSPFQYVTGYRHGGDARSAGQALRAELRPDLPAGVGPVDIAPLAEAGQAVVQLPENRHRLALLTEAGLAALRPPEPLADGWLYQRTLAVLYGPPKKGKTFVAIDLAMGVATGTPWLGGPTRPGHVVYCLGEGVAGMHRRLHAWRTHHHITDPASLSILPHTPQLGSREDVDAFIEAVAGLRPALVVIDTLARASVGVEENSSKEMGEVIARADAIKAITGACVLLVHHTGKDTARGTRGSSSLTGAIDTGIEVRGDPLAMTLVNTEQKDAATAEPRQFRAVTVDDSMVFVPTIDAVAHTGAVLAVMEALLEVDTGGVSTSVWMDQAAGYGVAERSFHRAKKTLIDTGEVRNDGSKARPLWTINTTGRGRDD